MIAWSLAGLAALLILSGYFSSAETAYTSLTHGQVNKLAETRGRRGRLVKRLNDRPAILLTTLLIGNNLANIGAASLATAATIAFFGSNLVGATTGLLTLTVLIFCEVTPKQVALARNEGIALGSVYLVTALSYIFRPVIWVVSGISRTLTRLLAGRERAPITLENLLQHVKAAEHFGVVESFEEEMVRNVFRINDTPVEAIMTHRTDLFVLDEETSVEEALREMLEAGHNRVPVFKDHSEHVSGIVTLRDVAEVVRNGAGGKLKSILSEPFIVPGTVKVHELLFRMKKQNLNLAVVLDEYGGLDGVVTREDVIEEIFGELYDEHEETEEEPVKHLGDGVWLFQGDADFWDVKDTLGIDLEHDDRIHTVGGYLMERLGEIPAAGKIVTLPEGTYEVLETRKNRIVALRFRPAPPRETDGE